MNIYLTKKENEWLYLLLEQLEEDTKERENILNKVEYQRVSFNKKEVSYLLYLLEGEIENSYSEEEHQALQNIYNKLSK